MMASIEPPAPLRSDNPPEQLTQREELRRLREQVRELQTEQARLEAELEEYRLAQAELSDVADELDQLRHSRSYRLGNAILTPLVAVRRIVRAWVRSGR
jgi:predicted RNase H-like nuclease (RuvC/YqgF family)